MIVVVHETMLAQAIAAHFIQNFSLPSEGPVADNERRQRAPVSLAPAVDTQA